MTLFWQSVSFFPHQAFYPHKRVRTVCLWSGNSLVWTFQSGIGSSISFLDWGDREWTQGSWLPDWNRKSCWVGESRRSRNPGWPGAQYKSGSPLASWGTALTNCKPPGETSRHWNMALVADKWAKQVFKWTGVSTSGIPTAHKNPEVPVHPRRMLI